MRLLTILLIGLALVPLACAKISDGVPAMVIECAPGYGPQQWTFSASGALHNSLDATVCMDIAERNASDGVQVRAWHCTTKQSYNQVLHCVAQCTGVLSVYIGIVAIPSERQWNDHVESSHDVSLSHRQPRWHY